jgi:hypothetical protein
VKVSDEGGGVRVDIEGDVPARTAEGAGQALGQDVLARGLGTHQQQVLPAQQRRRRGLPDLFSVILVPGLFYEPVLRLGTDAVRRPEGLYTGDYLLVHALAPEKAQQLRLPLSIPLLQGFYHVFSACQRSFSLLTRACAGERIEV